MSKDRTLRIAVVGANWGITHVEAWRRVPGVEVVAICTSRKETAEANAAKHGIPLACWNAEKMLDEIDIDIVDLIARPTIRTPIARSALMRGKHVLQPLPFADTFNNARELAKLAQDSHCIAMLENLHRYTPAFIYLKTIIASGEMGTICNIRAQVRTDILVSPPPNYVYEWITQDNNGASVLRNYGSQLLHCLTWMFGPIERVAGRNEINLPYIPFSDGSITENRTADTSKLIVEFARGETGTIELCSCMPAADGFLLDIVGTKGRAVLTADRLGPQNPALMIAARLDKALRPEPIPDMFKILSGTTLHEDEITQVRGFPLSAMCHRMAEAYAAAISADDGPSFNNGLEIMRVIEAAYSASDQKTWIDVPAPYRKLPGLKRLHHDQSAGRSGVIAIGEAPSPRPERNSRQFWALIGSVKT